MNINMDTAERNRRVVMEDLFKRNATVIDARKGGLILGPSHDEGGIFMLKEEYINGVQALYPVGNMQGMEFLMNAYATEKYIETLKDLNSFNEPFDVENMNYRNNHKEGAHLTPIPVGEDLSSLSAILLDDDYYHYAISHTVVLDDLHFIDRDAVVLLKAIAYISNSNRKARGESVRSEEITKHKNDIFRIISTFTGEERYNVPEEIKKDLRTFLAMIEKDGLDTAALSRELGLAIEITFELFIEQIKNIFEL